MLDRSKIEAELSALIAKYPNRWAQAVANQNLRGWFVGRILRATGHHEAYQRAAVSYAVDQRARFQS